MNTQRKKEREIDVERLDDIPLLIALQQRIGVCELIDSVIPRHWLHQGLSIGQLVVGWNSYILSHADHRKVSVEQWGVEHQQTLSELLGSDVRRTDFTDDRLGQVLFYLSKDAVWQQIEKKLWHRTVSVYQLTPDRVRLDATRISGYHKPSDDGLMQHGYNSAPPNLAQVKLMAASIDYGTSGHLLATEVVNGSCADDPLYLPMIKRIRHSFVETGLLYLGDSKMSAFEIRANLAVNGDFYLVPLAKIGEVAKYFDQWVDDISEEPPSRRGRSLAVCGKQSATLVYKTNNEGQNTELIAAGYEIKRSQQTSVFPDKQKHTWQERLLVVRSLAEVEKRRATLERNLSKATNTLLTLTPFPGRGKRQVRTETQLINKAQAILNAYGVGDYLHYTYRREQSVKTQYIGPGRGGANRPTRAERSVRWHASTAQICKVRYQITGVVRNEAAIRDAVCRMGWKVYATNSSQTALPLEEAVKLYRAAPRIERHFHLLKSTPIGISPMYLRKNDQIKGLARLLSLCERLMTLIEIVTRRYLDSHQRSLSGLYEGNPNRQTNRPTAQRLLRAFKGISRVRPISANKDSPYTTPLTVNQRQILSILGISENIYSTPKEPRPTLRQRSGQILTQITETVKRMLYPPTVKSNTLEPMLSRGSDPQR
jgi:transposase